MNSYGTQLTHALRIWNQTIFTMATALALAIGCSAAWAQSGAGSIQGTVTDATGAVIPGASIHVVNQATGVAVDSKSTNVGFYQVPSIFAGTYVVTITAPRMKTYVRTIELLVDQTAVINAALTPGAVTQQIQVSADLVQLTSTDSGTVGTDLENARINELPMNGRNLLTLTNEATPGLSSCDQSPSCANGMMPSAIGYEVDGVSLSNQEFGGANAGQETMPDPDAIQEVKMETSGEGAQFATPVTGVMTTKSGTNTLHGSLFETARNNGFGIAKRRQDPSNLIAPHLVRNEFGASVGGPIVVPHLYHGKDKSFFFFAYERYSLAQIAYTNTTVPTMAMRSGDWSGLVNGSGVPQQLYDPATTAPNAACPTPTGGTVNTQWCRTPFPKSATGAINQIPMSRISPFAQVIYAITPQPTSSVNPLVPPNYNYSNPGRSFETIPNITFRIDHAFNENNRAYLRYTNENTTNLGLRNGAQPVTLAATVNGVNYPAAAEGEANSPATLFAASVGYTHIFSPTFFSETIVAQQWMNLANYAAGASPHTDIEQEMGVPNNFGETGFPDVGGNLDGMNGTMYQYDYSQILTDLDENLTKTLRKHQMQFGGRIQHERFGYLPNEALDKEDFGAYATALENPATNSNLAFSAYSNTGYADADEFLGAAQDYVVNLQPAYKHFRDYEMDGYFQDNFHIFKSLTFNLGLRYEAHPAPFLKDGALTGFDFNNDAEVLGAPTSTLIAKGYTTQAIVTNIQNDGGKYETPQQAGQPAALMNNYNLNFLPRAGFAWQLPGKWGTILRGAYGRYIYPMPQYFFMLSVTGATPFQGNFTESYIAANQSPDGFANYLLRTSQSSASNPALGIPPIAGFNSANAVNSNATNGILPGQTFDAIDTDDAPDNITQVNVTLEQPMKGNSALRVSYIYAHDANLWNFYQFNNHPSAYVWEMQTGTTAPNGGASTIGTNQYAATATGPYDKIMWGSGMRLIQKTGWSTDNALQANYQRMFHHGVAYQISYLWSKPMHTGGEAGGDGITYPSADFIYSAASTMTSPYGTAINAAVPPPPPTGMQPWQYYHALNKFEYYRVDTYQPKQEIKFNGIVDMPVGTGKWLLHNANRFMNELVGGWQVAGDGNIHSQDFAPTASHWGPTNPLKVYKHNAPVSDCRSGTCYHEHEWFNGYLAPTVLPSNSSNANCTLATGLVTGLPGNWAPYSSPIDTDCNKSDAAYAYYGSDEVSITLPGKSAAPIAYAPASSISGANPFSKTVLNGPFNWTADASLFKAFPITERYVLRFNMDAFNAFNVQGYNNPNATDGTDCVTPGGVGCSSYNSARQLQFTLRLSF